VVVCIANITAQSEQRGLPVGPGRESTGCVRHPNANPLESGNVMQPMPSDSRRESISMDGNEGRRPGVLATWSPTGHPAGPINAPRSRAFTLDIMYSSKTIL